MPFSFITSATAAISASVFFDFSLKSTDMSVMSGMMLEKIFACFTCPAITACVMPAPFSTLMHCPSCPSEM